MPTTGLSNPNISSPIFTPSSSGFFTFTVSVVATSGCSNTGEVSILVNPLPVVTASNSGVICPGGSVTLNASSGSATNYIWSPSSTLDNATIANPVSTPQGPGTYVYTVIVSDANLCSKSATTVVTVNSKPIAAASYVPSLRCDGMAYEFKNLSHGGKSRTPGKSQSA